MDAKTEMQTVNESIKIIIWKEGVGCSMCISHVPCFYGIISQWVVIHREHFCFEVNTEVV
jgi:hypothetical protein